MDLPAASAGLQAGRRTGGEEEPLDADEEVPFSDSLDRERYVLPAVPLFTSPQASAFDGAVMLLGAVVDLLAAPSASDLQLLTSWAVGSGNVAAAAYLLAAIHALGDGPLQGQVPAAVLDENNTQLAELCAAQVRAAATLPHALRLQRPCFPGTVLRADQDSGDASKAARQGNCLEQPHVGWPTEPSRVRPPLSLATRCARPPPPPAAGL